MRARRLPGFACLLLLLPTVSVGQGGGDQDAAETQAAIKMLQKQRRDILVKVAEVLKGGYLLGTVDFGKVAEAERAVLMATVQLAETPEESVAALRDLQKSAAELVKKTESRVKFAPNGLADALQAQAILLEVRIELLKVEAKIKPRKK